jgi:uncharacterized protein (TIGR02598 family)
MKKGFTLVEVVVAIGIAGFCLICLMGLLNSGIQQCKRSASEFEASNVLSDVYCNLGTITNNRTNTLYYNECGNSVSADDLRAKYKVSLVVTNGITNIKIWWPVNATIDNSEGMLEVITHLKY